MRSLYLRIYLTVVTALALFALTSGWLVQRHLDDQRQRAEGAVRERVEAWAELLQRSLPPHDAPAELQSAALREWATRLRIPLALDDAQGRRIGTSESFVRRDLDRWALPATASRPAEAGPHAPRLLAIRLDDGRTLWVPLLHPLRPGQALRAGGPDGDRPPGTAMQGGAPPWLPMRGYPDGVGLAALLVVLFIAVAVGAWPVVRGLTRRLEALKLGVEAFGAGALDHRVSEEGGDEVAAVGASFNRAADRVEGLLRSHQSLLANASHELRSPLARLKMAVAMLESAPPTQRASLRAEIDTDIRELDALVEEVLISSRLDAGAALNPAPGAVSLLALVAEEAARVGASVDGADVRVPGDERLLRRALRNLLENGRRYGGNEVIAEVSALPGGRACVRVCDRGPGVPEAYRERIFEAFFRLPGHAEREGGVGLGLSLVRQIARRHDGSVRCEPRAGGGSCFVLELPQA